MKEAAHDLKQVYQDPALDEAERALNQLSEKWDDKYPAASRC